MSEVTPKPPAAHLSPSPSSPAPASTPATPATRPIKVKFYIGDEEVGILLLASKDFSTGSTGYFASGKVALGDDAEKGYQVQVQMVRIGSKQKK